ncbi:rhomboid family intramembrane serine protease [Candidatus Nephthysia bennettiae]|uniref:rhomboid family intramembrane serine protease n=1 Tax=Candidatus Nephthysia bennettiae TaxID=3127016 RepID=UPI0030C68CBB
MSTRIATCFRHPDRETGVRCQRCERPVCPQCMVPADVGVQCVECVRASPSRVISARRLAAAYRPYVTYALIAVNVAVWALGIGVAIMNGGAGGLLSGGTLTAAGGLSGARVAAGEWWRLITAGFLHTGLIHLGLNMAALFVFGPPLERALGRLRFGTLYLTALLAGSFGVLLLSPGSLTVGASGAIFGLLGGLIAGQRAAGISLRSSGIISLLVINLVFTLAIPGISIGGHLGGLAGGFVAASLLFNGRLRQQGGLLPIVLCAALAAACFAASLWVAGHPLRS